MKKLQLLVAVVFIISTLSLSAIFVGAETDTKTAEPTEKQSGLFNKEDKCDKCQKDPIKRLEEKKEQIQSDLKEGKLTKEEADALTKKVDHHIAKIKEFNSMPLPEKKEHLAKKFKSHVEQQVKDGKLTKNEGDKLLEDFSKSLNEWDGTTAPKFMRGIHKQKD